MRLPYQYVILRCVPRVDREEFVNVGVVVYCQEAEFLEVVWHVEASRIHALAPGVDIDDLCDRLHYIDAVCRGDEGLGSVSAQNLGTRFGFVKAPRSTMIQPGPVHGGTTADPVAELNRLLDLLVR
ncbi:DUF3037 domain-containing protein [Nocardioides marmoriginsengisoli]|uniref:DUF3037 domain-containing protein n=1 Tax=Nocardioides marmoriginsengisoli TaxID=661483 RepID=A0A3N0CL39_9ACTN|nr:DUF3037 domain-containing protein [Nocardioides marmoriginsengisoli]RNL64175.1 DUF3037 domain-containing protein [Nocardioides marmoriginsengisoli]